jgi:hypothetical protein
MPEPEDRWRDLRIRVQTVQNMLVSRGRGGAESDSDYQELRVELLEDPEVGRLMPDLLRSSRNLGQFWAHIKPVGGYADRDRHIWAAFAPVFAHLEGRSATHAAENERPIFDRWHALDRQAQHSSRMSTVWRVREAGNRVAPVHALKIMKYPKSPTSSAYIRFAREAQVLSRLAGRHTGIMPLVDSGELTEEGGGRRVFMVMPYYATSLDKAAKAVAGNAEYALAKILSVADSLEVAHGDGIIHRDVKPQNVLLDGPEQRVVLGDFGICLLDDEEDRFTHTESGTLGTPHFVAPELMGGGLIEEVRPTVDVYSLGKTLYAVLAGGDEAFPGTRHRDPRYDLVRRFSDPRLAHVHGAVDLLCAEDPAARPQSMTEARALLERVRDAIRENVPYREDMYRSGPSAEWRAARLIAALDVAPVGSGRRRDIVREALETTVGEVEAGAAMVGMAAWTPAPGGTIRITPAFLHLVDEIIAVVLPLLTSEDDALEDARAILLRWLEVDAERAQADAILEAAANVALHLVATASWRWQRGEMLGWCIQQLAGHYHGLVYATAFDGHSGYTRMAIEQALSSSAVITRIAPEVRDSGSTVQPSSNGDPGAMPAALLCVFGLVAMRAIWFGRVADLDAQLKGGEKPYAVDWPAFQPENRSWIELLPDHFLRFPRWEREVAKHALDAEVKILRNYWGKNAPVIARVFAAAYSLRRRDPSFWQRGHLSEGWVRWAGAAES